MKETAYIKQSDEKYKMNKKSEIVHGRRVEIRTKDGMFKIIYNGDFGDLPSKVRNLDKDTDLDAEVDVELDFILTSRQQRLA